MRKRNENYVNLKKLQQAKKLRAMPFHTFDVETKDGLIGKQLFCWSLSYRKRGGKNELKALQGKEDLTPLFDKLKEWRDKNHFKIIYVHNLGFDIRFLVEYMSTHGIEFFPILSNSNVLSVIIDEFRVKFTDSFQFLRSSQHNAEILWDVDEELRKIDCKNIFEKNYEEWTEEEKVRIIKHNANDVMALHQIMEKYRKIMFEIANIDCFNTMTLGKFAMKALRKIIDVEMINPLVYQSYNKETKRIYLDYDDIAERFCRESYYGGRVEVYNRQLLKNKVYRDNVSEFPAMMAMNKYPNGNGIWYEDLREDRKELMNIIKGKDKRLAIISVKVISNKKQNYPPLPKKINGRVCFTNCEFTGVYTSVELKNAYEMGYRFELVPLVIDSIKEEGKRMANIIGLVFEGSDYYFTEFVDKFFNMKKENKGGKKEGAKRVLNSSYGKFGQAFERKSPKYGYFCSELDANNYVDNVENIEDIKIFHHQDKRMWITYELQHQRVVKPFMNVVIATFITSYARINLLKQMIMLKNQYNLDTDYCDSDSVVIDDDERIKETFHLGGWNNEMKMKEVKFLAPKAYIMKLDNENKKKLKLKYNYNMKLKGIEKKKRDEILKWASEMNMSLDELEKELRKKIVLSERYMNFKESHRSGLLLNSKIPTKHYDFKNLKRNFRKNGTSEPWNMNTLPIEFMIDLNKYTYI